MPKYIRRNMRQRNVDITRLYVSGKTQGHIAQEFQISEDSVVGAISRTMRYLLAFMKQKEITIPYTKEEHPHAFSNFDMSGMVFIPTQLKHTEIVQHKHFWETQISSYLKYVNNNPAQ